MIRTSHEKEVHGRDRDYLVSLGHCPQHYNVVLPLQNLHFTLVYNFRFTTL